MFQVDLILLEHFFSFTIEEYNFYKLTMFIANIRTLHKTNNKILGELKLSKLG